jgi:FkbM family methyltransferase
MLEDIKIPDNITDIFIDIGLSHNMPFSMEWLNTNSDIFVIGIEPNRNNFASCQNHLSKSSHKERCHLIQAAVSDVDSPTKDTFYALTVDSGTSSLHKPKGRFSNNIESTYEVDVISLSYLLDNISYKVIKHLKTDTQGNDLSVIKSLRSHLKNVMDIYSEYDESEDYETANSGEELERFLLDNNFERYEYIYGNGQRPEKITDVRYANLNFPRQTIKTLNSSI